MFQNKKVNKYKTEWGMIIIVYEPSSEMAA